MSISCVCIHHLHEGCQLGSLASYFAGQIAMVLVRWKMLGSFAELRWGRTMEFKYDLAVVEQRLATISSHHPSISAPRCSAWNRDTKPCSGTPKTMRAALIAYVKALVAIDFLR